jgi:putative FmdB family regulatory protein
VPTYQYACTVCGHKLEAVQSFTDEPLSVCPVCAGKLRKVFSSVGVVFKGSGFYRTDSRRSAEGNGAKKEATPASSSGSDTTAGTDTSKSDKAPAKSGAGADSGAKGSSGSGGSSAKT